jgi:SAM-dependent methyltransferase
VTGIDFSERSIRYAREVAAREGLPTRYVNQNYLAFETEDRYQLALMIMCDFCALSPAQRRQVLNKFHAILEPGGSLLLDVYSIAAFNEREEASLFEENLLDGFWSPNKYYGFLHTFKYQREKVVLDKYTIVEEGRTRTVYNWLQYFSPEALESEFVKAGFAVDKLYSDVAGSPFLPESKEFAVVARKS